jgi:hypothetical protein
MHKVEFTITNGQHRRWSYHLKQKFGKGRSISSNIKILTMKIVEEEARKEYEQAEKRLIK